MLEYRSGEKNDRKKTESVFRFRVFGATEKPTLKSQGKKKYRKKQSRFFYFVFFGRKTREKPTEKNDFQLSVHNPACNTVTVIDKAGCESAAFTGIEKFGFRRR